MHRDHNVGDELSAAKSQFLRDLLFQFVCVLTGRNTSGMFCGWTSEGQITLANSFVNVDRSLQR